MLARLVVASLALARVAAKYPVLQFAEDLDLKKKPPPPATHAIDRGLPAGFSWRNVVGHGALLTPSQNQHVPQYCGACFAFATAHTLQDRVKIARAIAREQNQRRWFSGPDLQVAIQVLLNCGGEDFGWGLAGSCALGGSAGSVYRWANRFGGWPTATCFPYLATDGLGCRPDTICRNCMPVYDEPTDDDGSTACWAVPGDREDAPQCAGDFRCVTEPYPRIEVGDHGMLPSSDDVGAEKAALLMQLEIARGGPIACNIDAANMLAYDGNGLTKPSPPAGRSANDTDHVVEVVGWGIDDDGVEFWEIRNSWGEYYGDDGFFKVRRGVNDALVETGCTWVHPSGWGVPGSDKWQAFELGEHDEAVAALVAQHHAFRPWSLEPANSMSWPWTRGRFLKWGAPVFALAGLAVYAFTRPAFVAATASRRDRARQAVAADRAPPDVGEYQGA